MLSDSNRKDRMDRGPVEAIASQRSIIPNDENDGQGGRGKER